MGLQDYSVEALPHIFSYFERKELIRYLNTSNKFAELLTSRLNEKNHPENDACETFYRSRHEPFLSFFATSDELIYCRDVSGLLYKLGIEEYKLEEWRLFVDSSKNSSKCVLLHNTNRYGSVPIGHSTILKETYEAIKFVLEKILDHEHKGVTCDHLKMVNFLLRQQTGYTKYPYFLCM